MSGELTSSTGSPQGCVLSPLLYILYTDNCHSRPDNRFILKTADDSVIVSLLHDNEINHGRVVTETFLNLMCIKIKLCSLISDISPHKIHKKPHQRSVNGRC